MNLKNILPFLITITVTIVVTTAFTWVVSPPKSRINKSLSSPSFSPLSRPSSRLTWSLTPSFWVTRTQQWVSELLRPWALRPRPSPPWTTSTTTLTTYRLLCTVISNRRQPPLPALCPSPTPRNRLWSLGNSHRSRISSPVSSKVVSQALTILCRLLWSVHLT